MNKLWLLLKVTKSDLDIFKIKTGKATSKYNISSIGVFFLTLFIIAALMFSVVTYVYMIADPLHSMGLTYIALSMYVMLTVIIVFLGGVNKSQGTLFTSKDNDMLLSMPIKKSTIFASRLIRLILFEYIWTALIMLPTLGVYVYLEHPAMPFYITSLIMMILIPIIPTIIGSIGGYIIQASSAKFKNKSIMQLIFTFIFMIIILVPSLYLQYFIEKIVEKSESINQVITKIYWPLGTYIDIVQHFDIVKLTLLIAVNVAILIVFIYLFSIWYYKIISKLGEIHSSSNFKMKELKTKSAFKALLMKEMKRYFSSAIYVMNTIFGPILALVGSAYMLRGGSLSKLLEVKDSIPGLNLETTIFAMIMFVVATVSTTSSSISIEGKNLWILKSLPISSNTVFKAKIFLNLVLMLPLLYLAIIISSIGIKISILSSVLLILATTTSVIFMASFGLLVNLRFPKLDAPNDTVIVKQSMSPLITMLVGWIIAAATVIPQFYIKNANIQLYMLIVFLLSGILSWVIWKVLCKYGAKRYIELN